MHPKTIYKKVHRTLVQSPTCLNPFKISLIPLNLIFAVLAQQLTIIGVNNTVPAAAA